MSCFLSHYFLWHRCLLINKPIAIFEHDAVFIREYDPFIEILTNLACSFGAPSFGNFKKTKIKGVQTLFSKQYFPGAHSYIITPIGAKRFIEFAQKNKPKPTDVFLNTKDFSFPRLQEYYPYLTEVQENFSDGPLSGYCEYNNEIYWFNCFSIGGWMSANSYAENELNTICLPRIFRLYDLNEDNDTELKMVTAMFEYECDTTSYREI